MLVLSRRQDDQILFPNLGISVKILRVAGQKVRLGVEAPPEVKVLRHELRDSEQQPNKAVSRQAMGNDSTIQKRLQDAAATLNELYQLCDRDLKPGSERLIFELFRHLKSIDAGNTEICVPTPKPAEPVNRRALLVEDNYNESKTPTRTSEYEPSRVSPSAMMRRQSTSCCSTKTSTSCRSTSI